MELILIILSGVVYLLFVYALGHFFWWDICRLENKENSKIKNIKETSYGR